MKQHFLFAAATVLGGFALLASCDTTSNIENHQISIQSKDGSLSTVLYADQETDTVWVQSTESWTAALEYQPTSTTSPSSPATNPTTFSLSPQEMKVTPGYLVQTPVVITAKVPAQQQFSQALIRVTPKTGNLNSITRSVYQVGWLHISYPIATPKENDKSVLPNFSEVLSQKGGIARLVFDLYDSNPATHSLVSDAEWLKIPEAAQQPKKGHHVVELSFGENTSEKARTATLTLSSAGATTAITYVQAGNPKK